MSSENLYRIIRLALVLVGTYLAVYILFITAKYTYPFLVGIFFAYLLRPFINYLSRRLHFPRSLAVITSMLITVALIAGLITLLIAEVISGANYLTEVLPEHLNNFSSYIQTYFQESILPIYQNIISLFNNLETGQQDTIVSNIEQLGKNAGNTIVSWLQSLLGMIPHFIGWLPNAGTGAIFSLLATFFIAKEWNRLIKLSQRLLPNKAFHSIGNVVKELERALFGFIRAQLTLISITAVIVLIGLLILRVNYAITIALITGFVDLLPYLGTGFVFVPWIVYELIMGNFSLAIGLGVLYTVVIVQRQLMEPKILSSSIGLDPLATLIAVFVGFKLLGFLGLIAGPIVLVIIQTLNKLNVLQDIYHYIIGKKPPVMPD